jgi:hypothetical protein
MNKVSIIQNCNSAALALLSHDTKREDLANKLLVQLGIAEQAGVAIESVWASIAVTNGWKDQPNGIDGDAMPKTLANYRAKSRQSIRYGVAHNGHKNHAAWETAIRAAKKLAETTEDEPSERVEAIDLNEADVPTYVRGIVEKRRSMTQKNMNAFDKLVLHAIESFKEIA